MNCELYIVNTRKRPINTQTRKPSFSLKLFWAIRSAGVFPCLWSQRLLLALCGQNHLPQLGNDTGVFASQWQTLVLHVDKLHKHMHSQLTCKLYVLFGWMRSRSHDLTTKGFLVILAIPQGWGMLVFIHPVLVIRHCCVSVFGCSLWVCCGLRAVQLHSKRYLKFVQTYWQYHSLLGDSSFKLKTLKSLVLSQCLPTITSFLSFTRQLDLLGNVEKKGDFYGLTVPVDRKILQNSSDFFSKQRPAVHFAGRKDSSDL